GAASLSLDTATYYSSGSSLKVTGREDTWQGAAKALDSSYKAGGTYSFSAAVLQATGSSQAVKMTLQYNLNGEESYATIAEATASDKTWTKLENTEYTIPEGATDLLVYVELAESTGDYYLDDFQAAASGTSSKVTTGGGKVGDISAPVQTPSTGDGKVDPTKPMIAISFDDGTNPYGKRIIDALAKEGFSATFFYVGNWINDESQVKYAYTKGMEIANHTTSHPYLTKISASEIRNEYDQCAAKLKKIIGTEPSKLLRLPYLASNATVQSTLNDVPLITCSIDTEDWNGASKDQIVNKVKQAMTNGSGDGAIVLCHETYESTAAAIEELAPYIKAQGWQIVSISEMFEAKGKQLKGGQIYQSAR
ncbi:MAG: polysaccharide deacetylase family protein, partial [Ruminococcus sp.]|nr:polysaccharide deacetylase family protein [Ruminococcus sp.]